jgi:hypothetical protein
MLSLEYHTSVEIFQFSGVIFLPDFHVLFNYVTFSHYRSKRTLTTRNVLENFVPLIAFSAAVLSYLAVLSAAWTGQ